MPANWSKREIKPRMKTDFIRELREFRRFEVVSRFVGDEVTSRHSKALLTSCPATKLRQSQFKVTFIRVDSRN